MRKTSAIITCLLLLLLLHLGARAQSAPEQTAQGPNAHARETSPVKLAAARLLVTEDVQRAWAKADPQVPYFEVVELKSKEYRRIFPRGMEHLPATLLPREIYPATPDADARRWQYLGTREARGFRFAIFRLMTDRD